MYYQMTTGTNENACRAAVETTMKAKWERVEAEALPSSTQSASPELERSGGNRRTHIPWRRPHECCEKARKMAAFGIPVLLLSYLIFLAQLYTLNPNA